LEHRWWQDDAVPNHGVIDVSLSQGDGGRTFVARCKCGWESDTCQNAIHARALVEDHAEHARARARRRLDRRAS
jgi:hypothetical protein